MSDNKLTMTQMEFELAKSVAVHDKQLEILIADFQTVSNDIKEIKEYMHRFPAILQECKDAVDTDFNELLKNEYVTQTQLKSDKRLFIGISTAYATALGTLIWILERTTLFSFGG